MRLTQYAHGGGCACKIPPGELEQIVAGLAAPGELRVAPAGHAGRGSAGGCSAGGGWAGGGSAGGGWAGGGSAGGPATPAYPPDGGAPPWPPDGSAPPWRPDGGTPAYARAGTASAPGTPPAYPIGGGPPVDWSPGGGRTAELLVGLDHGDDAAVVRVDPTTAVISTTDFFTPVVDDPYDWGRIAAANALSDVYAMGGHPVLAVNLLGWPRDVLPVALATEVLRGGMDVARQAGCHLAGGHSVDDPEPKYGLAVTGLAHPDRLLRNDAGAPGLPLTLTKPLGIGVLNSRHKATGETFPEAVACMTTLNRDAAAAAVAAGLRCATDVTGFGLLGHLHKLARASGVTAVVDAAAVPYLPGARQALADGYVSGGTRRNLDWVRPYGDFGALDEPELLLLADAQTSGGLLVAGELPGHPVIGELVPPREGVTLLVR